MNKKTKRENGYYWLKPKTELIQLVFHSKDWIIGEWVSNSEGGFWELTGLATTFTDKNFSDIDKTPIIKNNFEKTI